MPERLTTQPSQALASHLRPIAALAWLLIGAVLPLGSFAQGLEEQRVAGSQLAAQVSSLLQREAAGLPRLWRYDTQKLAGQIDHLRSSSAGLLVEVMDGRGMALAVPALSGPSPQAPWAVWSSSPVAAPGSGKVWVAMDLRPLWRRTAALAGGFGALGLALAALMLWLPLRAVRRSEAEIRDLLAALRKSRGDITELAEHLEARVVDRSARLERALAELRAHEVHLRDLASQALRLQESERRAIARDLHDDIGQVLTGVRLQIQFLASTGQPQPDSAATAQRLLAAIDSAIDQTRSAVQRLAPPLLAEQGLAAALSQTCAALTSPLGPEIACATEALPPLDSAVETAAYRIAQEALTNAVRHAGASAIHAGAGIGPRTGGLPGQSALWVQVRDDGKGFDASQVPAGHGFLGMRDRAELLGGRLDAITSAGHGCTIRAELPCDQPAPADGQGATP